MHHLHVFPHPPPMIQLNPNNLRRRHQLHLTLLHMMTCKDASRSVQCTLQIPPTLGTSGSKTNHIIQEVLTTMFTTPPSSKDMSVCTSKRVTLLKTPAEFTLMRSRHTPSWVAISTHITGPDTYSRPMSSPHPFQSQLPPTITCASRRCSSNTRSMRSLSTKSTISFPLAKKLNAAARLSTSIRPRLMSNPRLSSPYTWIAPMCSCTFALFGILIYALWKPVSYVPPITFYYTEAIVSTPNILTVSSVPPLTTIGRSANCYASVCSKPRIESPTPCNTSIWLIKHTGLSTPEKPNPRAPGSVQSSTCTRTTRTLTRTRVWKMGAHHQKGPSAVHTKRRRRAATGKEHCTQPKSVNAAVHQTAKQSGKYSVRPPLNLWRRNHPALTSKLAASLSAIFLIATLASVPGIRYTSLTLSTISALDVMLVLAVPVTNLCTLLTSISFDRIVIDAM